jgi:hypothetical protein
MVNIITIICFINNSVIWSLKIQLIWHIINSLSFFYDFIVNYKLKIILTNNYSVTSWKNINFKEIDRYFTYLW